jgi:hypothetical protein
MQAVGPMRANQARSRSGERDYSLDEVDIFAAYVIPRRFGIWYGLLARVDRAKLGLRHPRREKYGCWDAETRPIPTGSIRNQRPT